MYGDANVRMLVIVQLDPDAVARSFLSSSAADYGFAVLKNADGTVLAQHNLPDQFSSNDWKLLDLRQGSQGYLTIGIKNTYFKPIHQAAVRLIIADMGIALLSGHCCCHLFCPPAVTPHRTHPPDHPGHGPEAGQT